MCLGGKKVKEAAKQRHQGERNHWRGEEGEGEEIICFKEGGLRFQTNSRGDTTMQNETSRGSRKSKHSLSQMETSKVIEGLQVSSTLFVAPLLKSG